MITHSSTRALQRALFVAGLALCSTLFAASGRIALETSNVSFNDSFPAIKTLLESKGYTVDIVNGAALDTLGELAVYDVVCIGDSGHGQNDWSQFGTALRDYVHVGGAVVASGWVPYFLSYQNTGGHAAIAEILPSIAGSQYTWNSPIIAFGTHPITDGMSSWTSSAYVNYGGGAKPGATVVATNGSGVAVVTAWDVGAGRVVHLGPNYFVSASAYGHQAQYNGSNPSAQLMLLNAIEYASFGGTPADTTAPVITVPANLVVEATSADGASVSFTASATDETDGSVAVTFSVNSGDTFALGTTTVVATATDAAGNTATESFTVTVQDTIAPTITSLTASTTSLWPANHKMVAITLSGAATDATGPVTLSIVSVSSNEPDNGLGDGDTANDIVVTGDMTLSLRAERSGKGNGRIYTVTVEARDAADNASTQTVTISVSKNGK